MAGTLVRKRIGREGLKDGRNSTLTGPKSGNPEFPSDVGSNVQQIVAGELRLVGNEGKAGFGLGAHQPLDRIGRAVAIVGQQHHAQQRAPGRIHGGFLELRRHHLAEAFEAADLDFGIGVEFALDQRVLVRVVAGVDRLAAMGEAVKRRHREIEVALRRSAAASAGRRR